MAGNWGTICNTNQPNIDPPLLEHKSFFDKRMVHSFHFF